MTDHHDRLSAPESELCCLGALMLVPKRVAEAQEILDEQAFTDPKCRLLWRALCKLGENADFVALGIELERDLAFGGAQNEFMLSAAQSVTTTAHLGYHIRLLERAQRLRALRREMRRLGAEVDDIRLAAPEEADAFFEEAHRALAEAAVARDDVSVSENIQEPAQRVVSAWCDPGAKRGLLTGIGSLDEMLGGIEVGNMTVIGARPSRGKTAIALQAALNMALAGIPCLFVTMEMTREQIAARAVANLANIELRMARVGKVLPQELEAARYAAEVTLEKIPLDLVTPRKRDYRVMRQMLRKHRGVQVVFVDYLQLFVGEGRDRFQYVGAASTECKSLAMEFETRMVVMSQLSREAEQAKPCIAHMRESGNVEQDANQIVLLSFSTEPDSKPPHDEPKCHLVADVAKNRDGKTGEVLLDWDRGTGRLTGDRTTSEALSCSPTMTSKMQEALSSGSRYGR